MKTLLAIEHAKSEIWKKLLEKNTTIKIDNILSETPDTITFFPIKNVNIEIIVGKYIQNITPTPIEEPKQDTTCSRPNPSYRTAKGIIDVQLEPKQIDIVPVTIEKESKGETLEENIEYFNNMFEKLKTTRIYTKILEDIKQKRLCIFKNMDHESYIKLIREHFTILENIFKDKMYTDKKIHSIIGKNLSSLEARLIHSNFHLDIHLDVDEMETFFSVMKNNIKTEQNYVPYNENKFGLSFYNYGLSLFPLSKSLDIIIDNIYGFNNIVYLPLPKSSQEDPYSFYTLDKITKDKRLWRMDCRLEDFTINLSRNILPYAISTFRIMYKIVFNDNDYRHDYSNKCQLTDGELEQLLLNILLMSNQHKFRLFLQKKVINLATYKPSENDKFNLYGDDSLQRKRLHQETDDPEAVDVIRQLFDTISTQELVDLYRSRVT